MDSPANRSRKAWRFVAALGCILGATGILLAAVLSRGVQHNTDQVDESEARGRLAICAIINYGTETLTDIKENPAPQTRAQKEAVSRFRELVQDMKATGIQCPPPPK